MSEFGQATMIGGDQRAWTKAKRRTPNTHPPEIGMVSPEWCPPIGGKLKNFRCAARLAATKPLARCSMPGEFDDRPRRGLGVAGAVVVAYVFGLRPAETNSARAVFGWRSHRNL